MNSCCSNPKIKNSICENCYILDDSISFAEDEKNLLYKETYSIRYKKFEKFLMSKNLDGTCFMTLLDIFPKIESSFHSTNRTNFINMEQLVIELLPIIGYEEYLYKFTPLKTKIRIKEVKNIVKNCFNNYNNNNINNFILKDMEFLCPKVDFVDLSKCKNDHTFII